MSLNVLLVYNPSAGDGLDADQVVSITERAGHGVEARSVKEDDWSRAVEGDFDLVVAAGGDGTVRKVFKELAGTGRTATVLPVGSANNIARSLGLADVDLARLVEGWDRALVARFDLGRLTWGSEQETFVESVGGGLFAAQLDRAEEVEREDEDKIEFGLRNLAKIVAEAVEGEWRVLADGRELSGQFVGVEVMNVRETGPNVPVAPAADTGDGLLELALIGEEHRAELAGYVDARLAGRRAEPPRFDLLRARRIELTPLAETPVRVDDQLAARDADEPMTVLVDEGLRVLLPV
jgi:diacylglycerol kinase family enzyme